MQPESVGDVAGCNQDSEGFLSGEANRNRGNRAVAKAVIVAAECVRCIEQGLRFRLGGVAGDDFPLGLERNADVPFARPPGAVRRLFLGSDRAPASNAFKTAGGVWQVDRKIPAV